MGQENIRMKEYYLGQNIFEVDKKVMVKKIWGPKYFVGPKTFFGLKKILWFENIFKVKKKIWV